MRNFLQGCHSGPSALLKGRSREVEVAGRSGGGSHYGGNFIFLVSQLLGFVQDKALKKILPSFSSELITPRR